MAWDGLKPPNHRGIQHIQTICLDFSEVIFHILPVWTALQKDVDMVRRRKSQQWFLGRLLELTHDSSWFVIGTFSRLFIRSNWWTTSKLSNSKHVFYVLQIENNLDLRSRVETQPGWRQCFVEGLPLETAHQDHDLNWVGGKLSRLKTCFFAVSTVCIEMITSYKLILWIVFFLLIGMYQQFLYLDVFFLVFFFFTDYHGFYHGNSLY